MKGNKREVWFYSDLAANLWFPWPDPNSSDLEEGLRELIYGVFLEAAFLSR